MNYNIFIRITIGFLLFGLSTLKISAQGAQKIGENPFTLNPSAIFEIESSTKGFLPPRMTRMQLNTIPATKGLMVYCTDCSTAAGSELMVSNGVTWTTLLGANLTYNKVMVGNGFGQAQERASTGTGNVVFSDSPIFTGTPSFSLGTTGVTPTAGNNSTAIATTAFVNAAIISSTIPDATTSAKGKVKLAGDLTGTAALPIIANNKITTAKILDANVTYAKIQNVTSGKILGRATVGSGTIEEIATTGTGSVVLSDSPTFTGTPVLPSATTAITQTAGNNTTAIATTEFVTSAIGVATIPDATTTTKGKVKLAGDLTGTADEPIIADNKVVTTKILNSNVTYAKIQNVTSGKLLGRTTSGTGTVEEIATTGTGTAVLSVSPTFTGTPTLPTGTIGVTQSAGNDSTALATTAFVSAAIISSTIPDATTIAKGKIQLAGDLTGTADLPIIADNKIITSKILDSNVTYAKIQNVTSGKILGRTTSGSGIVEEIATTGTGNVVLSNSPTFTGTPVLPSGTTAVTQTSGNNSTAVATTEFVANANATNANLTGDVTSVGNVTTLSNTGVEPGIYGNNLEIPVITVDSKGRITTLGTSTISPSLQEESVEYSVVADGETIFELSHTPSSTTLVRMYINGVLISQAASTRLDATMTYDSTLNGNYNLTVGDRIQFYYYF
jgi:hypothetical protein